MDSLEIRQGKNVGVYKNEKLTSLISMTGCGMLAADPTIPWKILPIDVSPMVLGEAVLNALAKSTVMAPMEFKMLATSGEVQVATDRNAEEACQAFGYKNKAALYRNMRHCSIHLAQGKMKFKPWIHDKLYHWTGMQTEPDLVLAANISPEEIGNALLETFNRCINQVA